MTLRQSHWFRIPASLLLLILSWILVSAFLVDSNSSRDDAQISKALESVAPFPHKVSWTGTVITGMTWGRLLIKRHDSVEFIAEPQDVDDTVFHRSKTTEQFKDGDLVHIIGYLDERLSQTDGQPWVIIEKIATLDRLQEFVEQAAP